MVPDEFLRSGRCAQRLDDKGDDRTSRLRGHDRKVNMVARPLHEDCEEAMNFIRTPGVHPELVEQQEAEDAADIAEDEEREEMPPEDEEDNDSDNNDGDGENYDQEEPEEAQISKMVHSTVGSPEGV